MPQLTVAVLQWHSRWREILMETERVMLKELGFSLYDIMEHPHRFILYYVKACLLARCRRATPLTVCTVAGGQPCAGADSVELFE